VPGGHEDGFEMVRRAVSKDEVPELERQHAVISTKLFAGRTVVQRPFRCSALSASRPMTDGS
jgi:hypothetical protein